jgi:hypothetical protein
MPDYTPTRLTADHIRQAGAQGLAQCEALELEKWLNLGMVRAQREWLEAEIERLAALAPAADEEQQP